MADHASMIRNLVVRAEDARLMDEMLVYYFTFMLPKICYKPHHIIFNQIKKNKNTFFEQMHMF